MYEYLDGVTSAVTDALGRRTSFGVDAAGRAQETVASDGGVSSVQYDAANQVLSTKNALGIVTTYKYDKNGNLESLKDARGGTTSWTYDPMDRVQLATDQVGKTTAYTYNALGRPETITDRRGLTTELRYDELQRGVFIGFGREGSPGAYQYQSTLSSVYDERGRPEVHHGLHPGRRNGFLHLRRQGPALHRDQPTGHDHARVGRRGPAGHAEGAGSARYDIHV